MPETIYFDKVQLLDGSFAEVKDSVARAAIQGGTYFLGVTTTELTDGATTTTITISGESVSVENGNMACYGNKEFVYAGADSAWHELGDLTNLGDLALKDDASGLYTPAGTVSKPNVTVTPTTVNVAEVDAAGSVSTGTIAEFDTAGSVTAGTANVPTAVTLPTLSTSIAPGTETLVLSWTPGSVTAGTANVPTAVTLPTSKDTTVVTSATMPTTKSTTVVTGVAAELDSTPAFTGTQATVTVS